MKKTLGIILLILSLHTPAFAAQTIGTITIIEGTASITKESGKTEELHETDPLALNDTIETAKGSKLLATFNDGTEIILGENASLKVDEFIYHPEAPEENKGRFEALKGPFLFTSGLIAKKSEPDVQIKTGVGSIGIRGTIVWGGPLDGQYGVLVQVGEVDFTNDQGQVTLGSGQGAFVKEPGAPPLKIGTWSDNTIKKAVRTVTLKKR